MERWWRLGRTSAPLAHARLRSDDAAAGDAGSGVPGVHATLAFRSRSAMVARKFVRASALARKRAWRDRSTSTTSSPLRNFY